MVKAANNWSESALLFALSAPFFVDGLFSLAAIYQAFKLNASRTLKQDLLNDKKPVEEKKLLPIVLDQIERYIYQNTDTIFMPEFLNESFKNKAFYLNGSQIFTQMTGGILMFAELYFSILAAVHLQVAPIFSIFVALYALMSITCYFGVNIFRPVTIAQSYLATTLIATIAVGYLFGAFPAGHFNNSFSFCVLTILLAFDSFLGYALVSVRREFSQEKKSYKYMDSAVMTFFFDNWKSS